MDLSNVVLGVSLGVFVAGVWMMLEAKERQHDAIMERLAAEQAYRDAIVAVREARGGR